MQAAASAVQFAPGLQWNAVDFARCFLFFAFWLPVTADLKTKRSGCDWQYRKRNSMLLLRDADVLLVYAATDDMRRRYCWERGWT
eukprot:1724986-Rhodomonas_salina.1